MIEPPSSGPQLAQVEVTFEPGEVIIGGQKLSRSMDSSKNAQSNMVKSVNGFSPLQSAGGDDDDDDEHREGSKEERDMQVEEGEDLFLTARAWPSKRVTLRMKIDPCPTGKVVMVFRNLQPQLSTTDISAQAALARFNAAPTHVQTAAIRDATVQALKGEVPTPVTEKLNIEYKLKGARMTYMRGEHMEMLKDHLPDKTKCTWPVPGFPGVAVQFTVEHDVGAAVKEEKQWQEGRIKDREERDHAVEGRKVKLYGTNAFTNTTPAQMVKEEVHKQMQEITAHTGARAAADIWTTEAITTIDAGTDGRKNSSRNNSGGRAFYLVLNSKREAEWLVTATKLPGSRLTIFGSPVKAHICRLRKQAPSSSTNDPPTDSHTHQRGTANTATAPATATATVPPRAAATTQPPAHVSSIHKAPKESFPAAEKMTPDRGLPLGMEGGLSSSTAWKTAVLGNKKQHTGDAPAPAHTPQHTENDEATLIAQLLSERDKLEMEKQEAQAECQRLRKQQDTNHRKQLDKLKQTMQADHLNAIEQLKEETAATIAAMRATFMKEMKAQQAVTLAATKDMMTEIVQGLMIAHQQELATQRTELLNSVRTMLGQMEGKNLGSSLDVEHDDNSVRNRKRRHDETEGDAAVQPSTLGETRCGTGAPVPDPGAGDEDDMDTHGPDSAILHSPPPSLPMAPRGGGGDGH
jgi:hypothetical protein